MTSSGAFSMLRPKWRTDVTQDQVHTYDKAAIARSVARMLIEIKAVILRQSI